VFQTLLASNTLRTGAHSALRDPPAAGASLSSELVYPRFRVKPLSSTLFFRDFVRRDPRRALCQVVFFIAKVDVAGSTPVSRSNPYASCGRSLPHSQ
jgi:hypothetical protein